MKQNNVKSILILFLGAIIWGVAFVAQTDAAGKGIGAFCFNGIRFIIGALALVPVILIFEREKLQKSMIKTTLLPALVTGVILFIASSLQQFGIEFTGSASKASFITGLYIVLVPIFAFVFLRKKTGASVWLGALLALAGLYFLSMKPGERMQLGDILVFIGTFFWASHILVVDRFIGNASPLKFSFVQMMVCGIIGVIVSLFCEEWSWQTISASTGAILYTGVLSSGVGYTCQLVGQRGTSPTVSTIILSTEAVFGALAGVIFNGEQLSSRAVIGCVMMFAGILLAQIEFPKKTKKSC